MTNSSGHSFTVTSAAIRRGDRIMVGNAPKTVIDMTDTPSRRKRVGYSDGTFVVLARHVPFTAARLTTPTR